MELISVIIPVYMVEKYLRNCLECVINQTYKNLEILLIDDGSPDNCGKICDEYAEKDERVKVVHKENGGVSSARNVGKKLAKGDFLMFLDSDDEFHLDMLEKLYNKQKETGADAVFCLFEKKQDDRVWKVNEKNLPQFIETKDWRYFFRDYKSKMIKNDEEIIDNYVFPSVTKSLLKKELIENINFNEKIKFAEDMLFEITFLLDKNCKLALVDESLYTYRMHPESAVHKRSILCYNHHEVSRCLHDLLGEDDYIRKNDFNMYVDCVINSVCYGLDEDLDLIANLGNKGNYKLAQKYCSSRKKKIRNFLVYHKMYFFLRMCEKTYRKMNRKRI